MVAEEVGPAHEVEPAVQLGAHAPAGDGAEAFDVRAVLCVTVTGVIVSVAAKVAGRRPASEEQQPGVEQEQAATGAAIGGAGVTAPVAPARSVIARASGCSL